MEKDMIEVPVSEIREPLRELFTYIPYFEERVGGTFKFQYWDEETGELKDMEGYEEANRQASFPDPVYDETFQKFKDTLFREIYYKFQRKININLTRGARELHTRRMPSASYWSEATMLQPPSFF